MQQVDTGSAPLTIERIQQYVWTRYVDFEPAPFELDEEQALALLAEHYREHPLGEDSECFYYGILAYERSFTSEGLRKDMLTKAREVFEAYRQQTSPDFTWDVVDDRYTHALEELGADVPTPAPTTTTAPAPAPAPASTDRASE